MFMLISSILYLLMFLSLALSSFCLVRANSLFEKRFPSLGISLKQESRIIVIVMLIFGVAFLARFIFDFTQIMMYQMVRDFAFVLLNMNMNIVYELFPLTTMLMLHRWTFCDPAEQQVEILNTSSINSDEEDESRPTQSFTGVRNERLKSNPSTGILSSSHELNSLSTDFIRSSVLMPRS